MSTKAIMSRKRRGCSPGASARSNRSTPGGAWSTTGFSKLSSAVRRPISSSRKSAIASARSAFSTRACRIAAARSGWGASSVSGLSFIDLDVVRALRRNGSANPADRKPFDKRSFSETKSSRAVMASQAKRSRAVGSVLAAWLFRRQSRKPLARSAGAGGEGAGVIVARFGAIAPEPDDPETGQGRRIERVAERDQRPGVAGLGGADEEGAGGRDVAFGEGDQTFGAQPATVVDRYRQRRAGAAVFIGPQRRRRLVAQGARQLADRLLGDRLRRRRRRLQRGYGDRRFDENRLLDLSLDV